MHRRRPDRAGYAPAGVGRPGRVPPGTQARLVVKAGKRAADRKSRLDFLLFFSYNRNANEYLGSGETSRNGRDPDY